MLKNFFKAAFLAVAAVCGLASCGDKTADYDALRPTLLGGVYFYRGYGGVDAVDAQLKSAAVSKTEGYKELFLNPYENESVGNVTTMLSNDWEITDGAGLKEQLEKLKSGESEHKAWDWARGVNIAWAGLRAGFITREEVDAYNASLVPLHRRSMQTGMLTSTTSSLVVRLGILRMNMVAQQNLKRLSRIFSRMTPRSTRLYPSSSPSLTL